ncbi:nuclear transport factor 2 family protein [Chitinophaga tropicalis]|uniref:DUF4440 domain-containing protein n=1 Tax=Chitinophaga tropicalis TaxID=2683588 RepID=A0A7K1U1P6_9BACT|nr:nuclear transport factor 2 family protein [Chitinophaga tropicalis]MVT08279.1 DUF4440 domain-containing protein [Chitinophaga tropicalis]
MAKRILATATIIVVAFLKTYGQAQDELYKEIYKQDSIFFSAFNKCDTVTYKKFLTSDFEFYHDLGGLHYLEEEMQSMREMCARNSHIRRELNKNSLEVHKLGENGALEIGVHSFYHTNPGQAEHISGTYKFVQVWQKKDNVWRLSRVISYDHGKMNND